MIHRMLEGPRQQLALQIDRDEPRAGIDVLEASHWDQAGGRSASTEWAS